MLRYSVITLLALLPFALSYSGGAPTSACGNLFPGHGIPPQKGESPFKLLAPTSVPRGSDVTLTLTGGGNRLFKGFIIRGYEGSNDSSGLFYRNQDVQPLVCDNIKNSVTHSSPSDKREVKMSWTAPNYPTLVTFNSTVVVNYGTIHLNQPIVLQVE